MKVGSLFTGYGGLDMAVGGELAWYAEIEKAACQVLATHHPNVPNLGDITTINWSTVEPVDVLTGGYPCQPFSHAGKRKGKNDERHLWPYVLDAIRAIRPQYAILENVSGHLSLGFDTVLTDLAKIGWAAEWGTFRASDIGAPHRRERLFIIAFNPNNNGQLASARGRSLREGEVTWWAHETAVLGELARGCNPLASNTDSKGLQGHDSGSGETPTTRHGHNKSRIGSLAPDTVDNGLQHASFGMESGQGEAATSGHRGVIADTSGGARTGTESSNLGSVTRQATESRERFGDSADTAGSGSQGRRDKDRNNAEESGQRSSESARGSSERVDWGKYAPAINRWATVLDRPAPAPTVERKDKRRLNPQFVEWMMGLPAGWVTGHGLSAAQELKMLGNGVVPQQARAAITQLMERTQQ